MLGACIAARDCILVTGATTGLPFEAAVGAAAEGGLVVGISPAADREGHLALGLPLEAHHFVLFTGFGFKGRNILNVRACDAVVVVGGGMGTLNEFTAAFDEGKVVGVLQGTGGVADEVEYITRICGRSPEPLVLSCDPVRVIDGVMLALRRSRRPGGS